MSNWRLLNYSICIALIITALSYVFPNLGGEYLMAPGIKIELLLTGMILIIPTGDYYYSFPSWSYLIFNIAFYSLMFFILLLVIKQLGMRQKI
jgi:hypothetical protein